MQGKKVHFIGICGKGMSAVAKLLQDQGWQISGSDAEFYPPVSDYLRRHGLPLIEGFHPKNIPADANLVVIGKNAKLVPESNAEVKAAFDRRFVIKSFPEILQELTVQTENIVVAGSYGKSTTAALIAWCLKEAGKNPGYLVGEIVRGMDEHAHLGSPGGVFVLEGDEYPSANWDVTSKFLYYNPTHLLLTSTSHDHINIFPTQVAFEAPFKKLISLLPVHGLLVACADEVNSNRIARESGHPVIYYGLNSPDTTWSATDLQFGEVTTFTLTKADNPIVKLSTSLLGRHNIENIVGASALLLERGLLTPEELARTVTTFQGVKRRMELLTQNSLVPVYEGFGSSYDKARSAISAAQLHFPNQRLVVVFEPHTFSWRSREALHWYDDVFNGSKLVFIYHPAAQGAGTHNQASHEEITTRVHRAGINVRAVTTPTETLALLESELRSDDVVLILTSGGFDGMIETIPALVEKKFAK